MRHFNWDEKKPEGSTSSEVPVGDIQFYDYTKPALFEGDYTITVTPKLALTGAAVDTNDLTPTVQRFTVSGPRFAIPTDDIHAMSPTPFSSGQFHTYWPHIVLNKRTAPWERLLNIDSSGVNTTPWMALIVLTPEELAPTLSGQMLDDTGSLTSTAKEFITKTAEDDTLIPDLKLTSAEETTSCRYIRLTSALFTQIAPQLSELAYLAHCRQVNTGDKESLGLHEAGWFSVVVANRFPQAPVSDQKETKSTKNSVHLISLEGWEDYFRAPEKFKTKTYIQLLSLASWSFNCLPDPQENFAQLFKEIIAHEYRPDGIPLSLLRITPDSEQQKELSTEAADYFTNGYVALPYTMRTGEKTLAWYRGPFTPFDTTTSPCLPPTVGATPIRSGESLMIYDQQMGVFNQTYAVAWQIGRVLALADGYFTDALITFRKQTIQQKDQEVHQNYRLLMRSRKKPETASAGTKTLSARETLIKELKSGGSLLQAIDQLSSVSESKSKPPTPPITLNASAPSLTPKSIRRYLTAADVLKRRSHHLLDLQNTLEIPKTVKQWLTNLSYCSGMPFNYLVPQEQLLPVESIRFFHVDPTWLDMLNRGALSVGIHTAHDEEINAQIIKALEQKEIDSKPYPVCGVLLRSSIVSGWPGLAIRAYDNHKTFILPLRQERLSSQILLCLYATLPQQISFSEPQEQLSFGVSGDDLLTGFIELRSLVKTDQLVMGSPLGTDPVYKLSLPDYLRSSENRVLDVAKLVADLPTKLATAYRAKNITATVNPLRASTLAIELVRAPEKVDFILPIARELKSRRLTRMAQPSPFFSSSLLARSEETKGLITDSPLKLNYQFTTTPTLLAINKLGNITLVIKSNPGTTIYVTRIIIKFIHSDDDSKNLTDDPASLSNPSLSDTGHWSIDGGGTDGIFHLQPTSSTPFQFPNETLVITWNNVNINGEVGMCTTTIIETTSDQQGNNSIDNTQNFYLKKYIGGFSLDSFRLNPPNIDPGGNVQLLWNVELIAGCKITLSWGNESKDVTNNLTGDTSACYPLLTKVPPDPSLIFNSSKHDVVFTLEATVPNPDTGQTYVQQRQVTLTVRVPSITNFQANPSSSLLGESVTLSWDASYVDHYTLVTGQGEEIISGQMGNTWTVTPTKTTNFLLTGYTANGKYNTEESLQVRMFQYTVTKTLSSVILNGPILYSLWEAGDKLSINSYNQMQIIDTNNLWFAGSFDLATPIQKAAISTTGLLLLCCYQHIYQIDLSKSPMVKNELSKVIDFTQNPSAKLNACFYSDDVSQIFVFGQIEGNLIGVISAVDEGWQMYLKTSTLTPPVNTCAAVGNNWFLITDSDFSTSQIKICFLDSSCPISGNTYRIESITNFPVINTVVQTFWILSPDKNRLYWHLQDVSSGIYYIYIFSVHFSQYQPQLQLLNKIEANADSSLTLSSNGLTLLLLDSSNNTIKVFDTSMIPMKLITTVSLVSNKNNSGICISNSKIIYLTDFATNTLSKMEKTLIPSNTTL